MEIETKRLLSRWHSLEAGDGLCKVKRMARALELISLLLVVVVVLGIFYKAHPAIIAVAAMASGWVIAERNALSSRVEQWPILKGYINWARVHEDLGA